jgi:hypothetical protein
VTSQPVTESALLAALTTRSPLIFAPYPLNGMQQYPKVPDNNSPYYQNQYPPNTYFEQPNGRYYYPPNGYQNGVGGYPQTALNRYPNYPPYGYQFPNGYQYGSVYQYPNMYEYYPYQYGK